MIDQITNLFIGLGVLTGAAMIAMSMITLMDIEDHLRNIEREISIANDMNEQIQIKERKKYR